MSFVLGLFQITMHEGLVSMIEGGLWRGVSTTARERTDCGNRHQNGYVPPGPFDPLASATGPLTFPPVGQPRRMSNMLSVK